MRRTLEHQSGQKLGQAIVFVAVLLGPAATWITAELDTQLYWSANMGWSAVAAGAVVGLLVVLLIAWAMRTNRIFSAIVRIQKDRGHVVVSSGPYRFVRHLAYTGLAILSMTSFTLPLSCLKSTMSRRCQITLTKKSHCERPWLTCTAIGYSMCC